MRSRYPIYLSGQWIETDHPVDVVSPYSGTVAARTFLASADHLEQAIQNGRAAQDAMKHLPTHAKADALLHIANGIRARREEFATAMVAETAKPIVYARAEVDRAILTFTDGAEECKRMYGEWMSLDRHPSGNNHEAIVRRFPIGLVAAISPFNFPLNLVAHKLAPAIAAGCPIILKPATKTPISALLLAELIDETQLPKGAISILPMDRETGDMLVTDDRFKLLTFTGSPSVGWDMKARAGKKKAVLELGGNAGLIVAPSANVDAAVKKSVVGAFSFSGQSCIHTQRIYIQSDPFDSFVQSFVAQTKQLVYGDPMDEKTQVSAMIDAKNVARIDAWVKEAVAAGAHILAGGTFADMPHAPPQPSGKQRLVPSPYEGEVPRPAGRRGSPSGYLPTVLTNTTMDMKICAEEAFAPIVILEKYSHFPDALASVNNSKFGLQAGVFTDSMKEISLAYDTLDVGGVIINNVPTFRADHMPYGGVKDSGIGREGVRYAMEDMTERKALVYNG